MSSKWLPPDRRAVKVNFDAAFCQHLKQSSSGVVIRNNLGLVMGSGVVLYSHVADAFATEALACLHAITFARDKGFQKVVVEGDSRTITIKVQKVVLDRSAIGVYVKEIRMMALNFDSISFQHTDRESNLVAHTIASMGFKIGNSQYWVEEVPPDAVAVTEQDRHLMQQPDQARSIVA
ncbi:hypothetical protein Gogos_021302 [Gossypium gossypioides]|uniref:RNase H type-1 domain-containing protein n=1 Tax=Gossypium gossypioides TaxID=34282 RepID=A0A7J9D3I9_GOSGO|nr:hypothetical protein [Gossypium gossypioides]